jgi:hypothetical protein
VGVFRVRGASVNSIQNFEVRGRNYDPYYCPVVSQPHPTQPATAIVVAPQSGLELVYEETQTPALTTMMTNSIESGGNITSGHLRVAPWSRQRRVSYLAGLSARRNELTHWESLAGHRL